MQNLESVTHRVLTQSLLQDSAVLDQSDSSIVYDLPFTHNQTTPSLLSVLTHSCSHVQFPTDNIYSSLSRVLFCLTRQDVITTTSGRFVLLLSHAHTQASMAVVNMSFSPLNGTHFFDGQQFPDNCNYICIKAIAFHHLTGWMCSIVCCASSPLR